MRAFKGNFTFIETVDCPHFTKTLRAFIRDLACLMVVIGRERKRELVKNVINRTFFFRKRQGMIDGEDLGSGKDG